MSSEILFRGKRKDNKEWVYGTPIVMHHNDGRTHLHHFIIPAGVDLSFGVKVEDILVEIIPETIGQDTGLKDKNGREIFKGDIIKSYYANTLKNEFIETVVFIRGQFAAEYRTNNGACYSNIADGVTTHLPRDSVYMAECEVIGNIHDNPELQEVE